MGRVWVILSVRRGLNMFHEYPDVVNVAQLQKMLGIGRNTAYKLLNEQTIKSKKIGRIYLIPKINIIKFLENK
jgi:excisionase family DNA binding protein